MVIIAHRFLPWLLLGVLLFPSLSLAQESEEEEFPGDDAGLEEEQDFPDLIRVDETGGVMDEFALLEEGLSIDEVESASKHRQSIFWSPSTITVITKEDIRSSGVARFADILRRVPGFDVYDLKGSYPIAGARALTEDDNNLILVLVDGREATVEISGTTLWNGLTIDLEEIERIELIRGPGSTLYGANAFAGVVNITTIAEAESSASVMLNMGESGFMRNQAVLRDYWTLGEGTLSLHASFGNQAKRSDNDLSHVYRMVYRTHAVLSYRRGSSLELSLHAGRGVGAGMFYTHIGDMLLRDAITTWVMGKAEFSLGDVVRLSAQYYYNTWTGIFTNRTNMRAYDIWIADFPVFDVAFPVMDAKVQLDLSLSEDLRVIAGGSFRSIQVVCDKYDPEEIGELRGGFFAHAQWAAWEKLQLTGGLRLDISSETEPALSPRAVAVFRPYPNHAFRLGYGLAFRKPSPYEMQLHVTTDNFNPATPEIADKLPEALGNENLTNEKVHSFEAGWRAQVFDDRLRITADLFFNIYYDTISFEMDLQQRLGLPDIRNSTLNYENDPSQIHAFGGEIELLWRFDEQRMVWGNLGLRRVTHRGTGETVESEPTLRANLGGRWLFGSGLVLDLSVHYVSSYAHPFVDPENLLNEREPMTLGDKFLLIGRFGYWLPGEKGQSLEFGLTVRAPLSGPFREYPGSRMPPMTMRGYDADWGGEMVERIISLYIRGTL